MGDDSPSSVDTFYLLFHFWSLCFFCFSHSKISFELSERHSLIHLPFIQPSSNKNERHFLWIEFSTRFQLMLLFMIMMTMDRDSLILGMVKAVLHTKNHITIGSSNHYFLNLVCLGEILYTNQSEILLRKLKDKLRFLQYYREILCKLLAFNYSNINVTYVTGFLSMQQLLEEIVAQELCAFSIESLLSCI